MKCTPKKGIFMYEVRITKNAQKGVANLSHIDKTRLNALIASLKASGPVQPNFKNYSKLGDNKYHCHLSYHWVACWSCQENILTIEVYYVGSREKAPY